MLDVVWIAGAGTACIGVTWSRLHVWVQRGAGCRCDVQAGCGPAVPGAGRASPSMGWMAGVPASGLGHFAAFILKDSVIQWFPDAVSQVLPGFPT